MTDQPLARLSLVNRSIGLLLMVAYGDLLLHVGRCLPEVVAAQGSLYPYVFIDMAFITLLPVIGIACILTPDTFGNRFSPRDGKYHGALLTDGFWGLPR
jgi:hypothetical protein